MLSRTMKQALFASSMGPRWWEAARALRWTKHSTFSNISAKRNAMARVDHVSTGGGFLKLSRNVTPRVSSAMLLGPMPHEFPHIAKRPERHDFGDNERSWQSA